MLIEGCDTIDSDTNKKVIEHLPSLDSEKRNYIILYGEKGLSWRNL